MDTSGSALQTPAMGEEGTPYPSGIDHHRFFILVTVVEMYLLSD